MLKTRSALSAGLARHCLDALDDGLLVFDRRERLRFANRAFEQLWSIERTGLLGSSIERVVEELVRRGARPELAEDLRAHLVDPSVAARIEIELPSDRAIELAARSIADRGRPAGRLWRFRDRTREKRSELAALEARNLESLGVLAGGIAHDFNNLLSSILGHTELGLDDVDGDSEAAESLRAIARVAERASQLTQQMLAYAGKGTVLVEPIDLSQVVHEVLDLVSVSIAKEIDVELELATDLPPIIADAVQIRQVIMNLLLNAAEATPEVGEIVVSTGVHQVDRQQIAAAFGEAEVQPGEFVFVRVTDSGRGMDEETMERIFDPFFSTKFTGRGLGLAAVQGIVRGHGGLVRVETAPDRGTTFTVDLPRGYAAESAPPSRS